MKISPLQITDLSTSSARPTLAVRNWLRGESQGCPTMEKRAIAAAGTKSAPRVGTVPDFLEAPANEEFSAVILHLRHGENLSRKQIGKIAGVGSETVKAWERGRQMAQWENLAKLARSNRSVRRWTLRGLGVNDMPEFMSPRLATAMMAAVYQVSHQSGPDGDAVREEIAQMGGNPYAGMNRP